MSKHTHADIDGKWFGRTEIGGQQAYTIGPFDTMLTQLLILSGKLDG